MSSLAPGVTVSSARTCNGSRSTTAPSTWLRRPVYSSTWPTMRPAFARSGACCARAESSCSPFRSTVETRRWSEHGCGTAPSNTCLRPSITTIAFADAAMCSLFATTAATLPSACKAAVSAARKSIGASRAPSLVRAAGSWWRESRAVVGSWQMRILSVLLVMLAPAAFAASIAIDVGHYFEKPGVISARGVTEFEYNLRLSRELAAALRKEGHKVLLIGDDGLADNLGRRSPRAAGMDLFISVHHDSVQPRFLAEWEFEGGLLLYSDHFSGFSLFVSRLHAHTEVSLKCASAIGLRLRQSGFIASRYHADPIVGENRPFADEENGVHYFDNLAVLKTAGVPALLFEAGVLVNRAEELRMRDPAVREKIVKAIVGAVGACLGAKQ